MRRSIVCGRLQTSRRRIGRRGHCPWTCGRWGLCSRPRPRSATWTGSSRDNPPPPLGDSAAGRTNLLDSDHKILSMTLPGLPPLYTGAGLGLGCRGLAGISWAQCLSRHPTTNACRALHRAHESLTGRPCSLIRMTRNAAPCGPSYILLQFGEHQSSCSYPGSHNEGPVESAIPLVQVTRVSKGRFVSRLCSLVLFCVQPQL